MLVRLSLHHARVNFRAHRNVELPITELPIRGDIIDLPVIQQGLPSVKVTDTYSNPPRPPEIVAIIRGNYSGKQCNVVFTYEDGWATYGSF